MRSTSFSKLQVLKPPDYAANLTSMETCAGMLHANPGFRKPLLRYLASKSHRHWLMFINISIYYSKCNYEANSCVHLTLSFSHPLLQSCSPSTPRHAQPEPNIKWTELWCKVSIKQTSINRSITDLICLWCIYWALLPLNLWIISAGVDSSCTGYMRIPRPKAKWTQ